MAVKIDKRDVERCAECGCFNLRKATRVITQLFDRTMQPSGLRGTQFSILAVLSLTGPSAVTRLSENLVMDRTTLTRNLRPLEKQGFISVARGDDQRTKTVALTGHGKKVLEKALPLWESAQKRITAKLGRKRFASLIKDLSEISSLFSITDSRG